MMCENEYLSKDISIRIKGILAIAIIICHIRGQIPLLNDTIVGKLLTSWGYLAVSMFLFYSGYGIRTSCKIYGKQYANAFFKNRFLRFYSRCVLTVLLYCVYSFLAHSYIPSLSSIIKSLLIGESIVIYGWYLQALTVIYLICFFIFKITNNSYPSALYYVAGIIIYCLVCVGLSFNRTIYECVFAFLCGIIWCDNKQRIDKLLSKYWFRIFLSASFTFILCLLIGNLYERAFILKVISAFLFPVLVNILLFKYKPPKRPWLWLGEISFEIYALQGMFVETLKQNPWDVFTSIKYSLLVVFVTLLASFAIHPIYEYVANLNQKTKYLLNP